MIEVTTDFAIEYLLDDCDDCPENKDGECMTQSHCFEVKQMAIKALKQFGVLQEIRQEICFASVYNNGDEDYVRTQRALEIIDKHIVESEG